jgi:hypothetical protein
MPFTGRIVLQPNTSLSHTFAFLAASSATANDGFLPYGRTITEVEVNVYTEDGTNVTENMIVGSASISDNMVTVRLQYPGIAGRYKIEFILLLDNGETDEDEFLNIFAVDK